MCGSPAGMRALFLRRRACGAPDAGKTYTGAIGRGGRVLGKIEEYFLETLAPGDTFLFSGEILALLAFIEAAEPVADGE